MDLRSAINNLSEKNMLINVSEELSTEYEVAYVTKAFEGEKAVLFNSIKNSSFKIVSGVYGDRKRLAIALGLSEKEFFKRYLESIDAPSPTETVTRGPVHENFINGDKVDLSILPIPRIHECDGGPYLTASIVIAKDPETGIPNASYHRMMPIAKNKLTLRIVKRDLWHYLRTASELGQKLEVAVVIGVDPATAIAASTTVETYINELEIASSILNEPLKLVKGKKVNIEYPANAEIVLEGYIDPEELHDEGPFIDITGTCDIVRKEPVLTVESISFRNNPIFQFILPAGSEHKTLMGFPKEAKIYKQVSSVTPIVDVHMSRAGSGWFEAIISINKRHEDEPIDAGLAAFAAHASMKKVIIVDPDIDIHNYEEVHWAVLTRANPVRDYVIIPRSKGSSLDKSGEPKSKVIIDATIKGEKKHFEKGKIPGSERAKEVIEKIKGG
ncbi:MAG: UbiD family decarboxylase [Candidatus Njordarchaeia archaeon]